MMAKAVYKNDEMVLKMHKKVDDEDDMINFLHDFTCQLKDLDIEALISEINKNSKKDVVEFEFSDLESVAYWASNAIDIKTIYHF